ncbi:MAG: zf-HC2 domain-containing protein [Bacillota bacterium]
MTDDCATVLEHLWEFLDAELSGEDLASISRHIALCTPCRFAAAFDRAFLELLRRQRRGTAPAQLLWEIRSSVRTTTLQ